MWLMRRMDTTAAPWESARSMAWSRAQAVANCPKPSPASTSRVAPRRVVTAGRPSGRIVPCSIIVAYCGMRITPWLSCPARLARTRCAATSAAISSGAPRATKTLRPSPSRASASTVRYSAIALR